jgi:hypothetical protein
MDWFFPPLFKENRMATLASAAFVTRTTQRSTCQTVVKLRRSQGISQ